MHQTSSNASDTRSLRSGKAEVLHSKKHHANELAVSTSTSKQDHHTWLDSSKPVVMENIIVIQMSYISNLPISSYHPRIPLSQCQHHNRFHETAQSHQDGSTAECWSILKLRWSSKWLNRPHLGSYAKAWDKGQHHQGLGSQLGEFQGDMIQRQETNMTRSQVLGISAYSHVSFPLLGCIW